MTTSTPKISDLAVIDSKVEDYSTLAASLKPGTEIIVLNPETDGIAQIATALKNRNDIKAVHIISHGEAGSLLLGSTKLNSDNLDSYQESLKQWFSPAVTNNNNSPAQILNAETRTLDATATTSSGGWETGFFYENTALLPAASVKNPVSSIEVRKSYSNSAPDILLYGCDVAQGDKGNNFLSKFSELTGADVAASSVWHCGKWCFFRSINPNLFAAETGYDNLIGGEGDDIFNGNEDNDFIDAIKETIFFLAARMETSF